MLDVDDGRVTTLRFHCSRPAFREQGLMPAGTYRNLQYYGCVRWALFIVFDHGLPGRTVLPAGDAAMYVLSCQQHHHRGGRGVERVARPPGAGSDGELATRRLAVFSSSPCSDNRAALTRLPGGC